MADEENIPSIPDLSNIADVEEVEEWLQSLDDVVRECSPARAQLILQKLGERAYWRGVESPYVAHGSYINSIRPDDEAKMPEDQAILERIDALTRWNAIAMVVRAGKRAPGVGGHIASYASASTLYDIGYTYFFRAESEGFGGDLVYIQGHSSPGIYARAFLEGRLDADYVENFRREVSYDKALPSYPHPWLMPEFWQFATVSMGLGPIQAIYQARFLKYLHNRGLVNTEGRKVWAFCGDGEMDEPESLGAISLPVREQLNNLIFVINCNLQRLDGPVRGNTSILRELEATFRGVGWQVIKVIWGSAWDRLFAKDSHGLLVKRMNEACDGDYQNYKAHGGAYMREHFFGKYPELLAMVADMSDDDIAALNYGGHDAQKVFAAFSQAMQADKPVVILPMTVKGYGMGDAGEALNITHQQKNMTIEQLKIFRDRFNIPLSDEQVADIPLYRPSDDGEEVTFLRQHRDALGGPLPARRPYADAVLNVPERDAFASFYQGLGEREISSTMAFVRILNQLIKDKTLGPRIVPIVPDESRTFGMEGMFRQLGIYSPLGQRYTPVDIGQVMYYKEDIKGQILEEGLNEAGAMCSWISAATSYSHSNFQMIPFYIYYSMFGFQRTGDLSWAAGDMQARGFLVGATAGRTTINGEGLQHQDGHSHLLASTIPNCRAYDPTYAYELAIIIQDGLKRMLVDQENVFYYLTVMNENYQHPAMPKGAEEGILKGMYCLRQAQAKKKLTVQLLGSGTILREVIAAADTLLADYDIDADIWSVTSFNELRREALAIERDNMLHPERQPALPYVSQCLNDKSGPVIAASDYMRLFADQIRPYVKASFKTLGTDGFGRSDTREALREFFEVDRNYIIIAALHALAEEGHLPKATVAKAIKQHGIDPEKPNPVTV